MEAPDLEDAGREVRYRSAGTGQGRSTRRRARKAAAGSAAPQPPQRTGGSLAANSHLQRQGFQRSQRFLDRATRWKIEDSIALRDLFLQVQNEAGF